MEHLWKHSTSEFIVKNTLPNYNDARPPLFANLHTLWITEYGDVPTEFDRVLTRGYWEKTPSRCASTIPIEETTDSDWRASYRTHSNIITIPLKKLFKSQYSFKSIKLPAILTMAGKRNASPNGDQDGNRPRRSRRGETGAEDPALDDVEEAAVEANRLEIAHQEEEREEEERANDEEEEDDEEEEEVEEGATNEDPQDGDNHGAEADVETIPPPAPTVPAPPLEIIAVNPTPFRHPQATTVDFATLYQSSLIRRQCQFEYKEKAGMPIVLAKNPQPDVMVYVNTHNDKMRFNGSNRFFLKLGEELIDSMRTYREEKYEEDGKYPKDNQRECFKQVLCAKIVKLQDDLVLAHEPPIGRYLIPYWNMFMGFSKDENRQMKLLLHFYAMARLGSRGFNRNYDEYEAAVFAANSYFLAQCADTKKSECGSWAIGMVHALSDHLESHGYTPITFGATRTENDLLKVQRASFDDWRYTENGARFNVENRPKVVANLKSFILTMEEVRELIHTKKRTQYEVPLDILPDSGPPHANVVAPPAPGVRQRLSLG